MLLLFLGTLVASWVGVGLFRRWTLRRGLLDHPNERSSHTSPTPRGGGMVITLVCLAGYLGLGLAFGLPVSWGYFAGAALVAGISWIDDIYSLPFWIRLPVHVIAAVLLVADTGFWAEISLPMATTTISLPPLLAIVATVGWVVWFLNGYNFMDGIDGIAGSQAVIAALAWTGVAFFFGETYVTLYSVVIAGASLGFLFHNWQPARIFMGDVGSGFLGFTLAGLPLLAQREGTAHEALLPLLGVSFLWFFLADTIFTLFRRLVRGQRVWEAHREHVYQRLVISGWQHSSVSLLYAGATATVSVFTLLAALKSGIYSAFALLSLVLLTLGMIYAGTRKIG